MERCVVMPLFKFDQDTENMLMYSLALFNFRGYVSGFEDLVKYLAALSFERVMFQTGLKFEKFRNINPRDVKISDIINFLEEKEQIDKAKAKKLRRYWDFRNAIMHTRSSMSKEQIDLVTKEILRFLCEEAGIDFDEQLRRTTFEDISTFGKGSTISVEEFRGIYDSDFDNFIMLYKKCAALQREINRLITGKLGLKPEQISSFIPNSGGIWLPWVKEKIPNKRAHIHRASLGIAFTPINIRIGLDFGNKAHLHREKYYELLLKEELKEELKSLRISSQRYIFYDTFWYYHIRNTRPLEWYFEIDMTGKQKIEEAIRETKLLEGKPLTANKFLIGRVIDRNSEEFPQILNNIIEEAAKTIEELYPILEKIEVSCARKFV